MGEDALEKPHPHPGPPLEGEGEFPWLTFIANQVQAWRKVMEAHVFSSFSALRQTFGNVDKVGELYVFGIGGNKFRLVAFLHAEHQIAYVKHVLTHAEYDRNIWRQQ